MRIKPLVAILESDDVTCIRSIIVLFIMHYALCIMHYVLCIVCWVNIVSNVIFFLEFKEKTCSAQLEIQEETRDKIVQL